MAAVVNSVVHIKPVVAKILYSFMVNLTSVGYIPSIISDGFVVNLPNSHFGRSVMNKVICSFCLIWAYVTQSHT